MSRIEATFKALNRPALITFIMAGDPDVQTSMDVLKALPDAGADIIELGMPFSDPMADGPTIQLAGQRALKAGANMHRTLQMVRNFRAENTQTPLVLMGYYNPILQYGVEKFMNEAAEAGVDGLIIVDLPPEEASEAQTLAKAKGLDIIRLLTPTTTEERLPKILEGASGFLYYVSITGVTGAAQADLNKIKPHIEQIKTHTDLPIAIGFGIKTPADAAEMAAVGDAIVVGSSIVQTIAEGQSAGAVSQQVSALAKAIA
ncbi:MAG: tryptophan synthase subunit alpha [Rhodospirillales bacterium]|nr:tryptophan synthase subunit alpha [Rhodospirillales bacterium]